MWGIESLCITRTIEDSQNEGIQQLKHNIRRIVSTSIRGIFRAGVSEMYIYRQGVVRKMSDEGQVDSDANIVLW